MEHKINESDHVIWELIGSYSDTSAVMRRKVQASDNNELGWEMRVYLPIDGYRVLEFFIPDPTHSWSLK